MYIISCRIVCKCYHKEINNSTDHIRTTGLSCKLKTSFLLFTLLFKGPESPRLEETILMHRLRISNERETQGEDSRDKYHVSMWSSEQKKKKKSWYKKSTSASWRFNLKLAAIHLQLMMRTIRLHKVNGRIFSAVCTQKSRKLHSFFFQLFYKSNTKKKRTKWQNREEGGGVSDSFNKLPD